MPICDRCGDPYEGAHNCGYILVRKDELRALRGKRKRQEERRSFTPRGFVDYDSFTDVYGATVTIRESSKARVYEDDGGPWVWIFVHGGTPDNDGAAHLDVERARLVRDALDAWLEENT